MIEHKPEYYRGYITLRDIVNVAKNNPDSLDSPIAVCERTSGLTRPYLNDDEIIYGVRISSKYDRNQRFNGFIIEGLSKEEILKYNNGRFGII